MPRRVLLAAAASSCATLERGFIFGHPMADCRLVPVLLHHTLAASTADGRAPPCLSPAALIAVTARCCECVRPPQEPTATTGTSVVTETGGVTVLPDWGGTKVLPDYMDVRGILDIFAKARALHLCGPPAEWQAGADASAGAGAEVSLVLFPLLEVLELEDCAISRLKELPSSLRHLQATAHRPTPTPTRTSTRTLTLTPTRTLTRTLTLTRRRATEVLHARRALWARRIWLPSCAGPSSCSRSRGHAPTCDLHAGQARCEVCGGST